MEISKSCFLKDPRSLLSITHISHSHAPQPPGGLTTTHKCVSKGDKKIEEMIEIHF